MKDPLSKRIASRLLALFIVFMTAAPVCLFARSMQELVPAGHWVYDSIEKLSIEAGVVNFADNDPMTIEELSLYLGEIDVSSLSEAGQAEYRRIQEYFDYKPIGLNSDLITLGLEPSLNISGFYKTNDDIDWVYDRYEREPVIKAPLTFTLSDYVAMSMDLSLDMNKNTALKNSRYTNIPITEDDLDINFPDTGYFSAGHKITDKTGVSFQLGKGARNIGRSMIGSMIWSEYLTGVSYGQLNMYSPNLKYTGIVSQFNVDRYMYLHQLDARFFKKFTFTVLEGIFVNAPMELRFLNPWTIFHGMAPWRDYDNTSYDSESHTCAYLGLKFQFVPVSNLKFYGTFAMTQFQTLFENSNYPDNVTPNGMGGQLGGKYYVPLRKGRLAFALEGSYAQPYLYIKESPNWSLVRTYVENMGEKKYPFYEWIGSPFGPDTISGEMTVGYEVPEKWSVNLVYLFMARGEMSGTNVFTSMEESDGKYSWGGLHTGTDYPAGWCYPTHDDETGRYSSVFPDKTGKQLQSLVTPTGTPEYVNRISVKGIYRLSRSIEFAFQPSYVVIFNHNHESGETRHGLEIAGACSFKL